MSKRKPVGLALRFRILERDGHRCQYCGARAPDARLEVDHIVPISRGGRHAAQNMLTACFDCNRGKRAETAHRYERVEEVLDALLARDPDGCWRLVAAIRATATLLWELDTLDEGLELARTTDSASGWLTRVLKYAASDMSANAAWFAEAAE